MYVRAKWNRFFYKLYSSTYVLAWKRAAVSLHSFCLDILFGEKVGMEDQIFHLALAAPVPDLCQRIL